MDFICDDGALSCVVYCDDVVGNICPNAWSNSSTLPSINITTSKVNYNMTDILKPLSYDESTQTEIESVVIGDIMSLSSFKLKYQYSKDMTTSQVQCDLYRAQASLATPTSHAGGSNDKIFCCTGKQSCFESSSVASFDVTRSVAIKQKIYCDGSESCRDSTIYVSNRLYCRADRACRDANILINSDINYTYSSILLVASAGTSMKSATIQGSHNNTILLCTGYSSCAAAKIGGVRIVYAFASKGVADATITSINSDSSPMYVFLLAHSSGLGLTINCQDGDTCIVYCNTQRECSQFECNNCTVIEIRVNMTLFERNINGTVFTTTTIPTTTTITSTTTNDSLNHSMLTTTSASQIADDAEENSDIMSAEHWENAGTLGVVVMAIVGVVMLIAAFCHYYFYLNKKLHRLLDKPNVLSILKCIHNVCDLWTDLMFTIILFVQKDELIGDGNILWYLSAFCLVVPYILQCILCLWYLQSWQDRIDTLTNLSNYPSKYEWFIIACTMMFGFYATIELTRSKLFYLTIFHSQMSDSYYQKLKQYRFLNIIILENIPQLFIQYLYIFQYNGKSDIIACLSMIFSVLSIILASLTNLSFCISKLRAKTKFKHESSILLKIQVRHAKLSYVHLFSNKTFQDILSSFLHLDESLRLFDRLDDIHYDIETFYVCSNKYVKNLTANIQIHIHTNDKQLTDRIMKLIRECDNNQLLKHLVIKHLKLKGSQNDLQIKIISMNLKNEDTGDEMIELGKVKSISAQCTSVSVPQPSPVVPTSPSAGLQIQPNLSPEKQLSQFLQGFPYTCANTMNYSHSNTMNRDSSITVVIDN